MVGPTARWILGFHQGWCQGMVLQDRGAHKRCPSCSCRWRNVHVVTEGARVALVEAVAALRAFWRVIPKCLPMGGGVNVTKTAVQCSASSHSWKSRGRQWKNWQWVPRWLIQAWVSTVSSRWVDPRLREPLTPAGRLMLVEGFGDRVSRRGVLGSRHCMEW